MNRKLTDLISICRKAGRAETGFDPTKKALEENRAKLVLIAEDISPKTEKEIRFFSGKYNVQAVKCGCTMDDLFRNIGKKVGIIAVCDEGFAKKALAVVQEEIHGGNSAYE